MDKKERKKRVLSYPPADPTKECPLGTLHQKTCAHCRFAIQRYTQREIDEYRSRGKLEMANKQYACIFTAILIELMRNNQLLERIK